ncbi:bifunctional riboflavin kinase/FAD synthetase [Actinomycetota bacterium]
MHRWTDTAETPSSLKGCVATFGNFDGLHRGHRAILTALREEASRRGVPAVVVTFEPHPVTLFHPERELELISPGRLRDQLMADAGVDGLLVIPFTRDFANLTPEEYVTGVFVEALGVSALVVGEDTRGFGRGYTGDVGTLQRLGEEHGFDVLVLEDVGDTERWSSSKVRHLLTDGDVAGAARILGRPHMMVGTVVHGEHRGRELGYPTANLSADSLGLIPADGVYAGWLTQVDLPEGEPDRTLPAAISVGLNPTFDDVKRRTVEAYVLDRTDLDLYGKEVVVEFIDRVRDNEKFDSLDSLLAAIAGDVETCRRILTTIVP